MISDHLSENFRWKFKILIVTNFRGQNFETNSIWDSIFIKERFRIAALID